MALCIIENVTQNNKRSIVNANVGDSIHTLANSIAGFANHKDKLVLYGPGTPSAQQTFNDPDYVAPAFTQSSVTQSYQAGTSTSAFSFASYANRTGLTYTATSLPPGMTLEADGDVPSYTPSAALAQTTYTITATAPEGDTATISLVVTVTAASQPTTASFVMFEDISSPLPEPIKTNDPTYVPTFNQNITILPTLQVSTDNGATWSWVRDNPALTVAQDVDGEILVTGFATEAQAQASKFRLKSKHPWEGEVEATAANGPYEIYVRQKGEPLPLVPTLPGRFALAPTPITQEIATQ